MPNYQNGKIYQIIDNTTGRFYIGSTTQPLYERLRGHKKNFKEYLDGKGGYMTSFQIIGNDDYDIVLIENYPCQDKSQLNRREGEYIRINYCVNKMVPGRTSKEYKHDMKIQNKGFLKETINNYHEARKNSIEQPKRDPIEKPKSP